MSKHLHPGKAAFNGVLAADLAREGFTGATRILEGDRGFFRAMSACYDASRITDGLGSHWKIGENCYKLHSCCGHTHTAIDVSLDQRARAASEANGAIESIHIETYGPGFEIVKELNPNSPYQAKFSIAYCVAAALLEGKVGLEQFAAERFGPAGVRHSEIADLLARTRLTVESDLTAKYPAAWPARVTVAYRDGTVLSGAADYPRGNPENPVSGEALEEKFMTLIEPRFGPDLARLAIETLESLDSVSDMALAFRDLRSA
jgi:2-methylcitrate dehydratase PrpD